MNILDFKYLWHKFVWNLSFDKHLYTKIPQVIPEGLFKASSKQNLMPLRDFHSINSQGTFFHINLPQSLLSNHHNQPIHWSIFRKNLDTMHCKCIKIFKNLICNSFALGSWLPHQFSSRNIWRHLRQREFGCCSITMMRKVSAFYKQILLMRKLWNMEKLNREMKESFERCSRNLCFMKKHIFAEFWKNKFCLKFCQFAWIKFNLQIKKILFIF